MINIRYAAQVTISGTMEDKQIGNLPEVIIKTNDEGHYKAAQDFARSLIEHKKPQENAARSQDVCDDDHCPMRVPRIGRWIYWNGWVSNHDLRIDDAFCSECGYRHPAVRLTEGYPTVEEARASVLDKLAKECPNCGAKMIGGGDNA